MNGVAAPARLELDLPATPRGLAQALEVVDAFLRREGVAPGAQGRVLLLLEEAVMNVAMHGGLDGETQRPAVQLALTLGPDTVALQLEDEGIPFDPRQAPPPQRPGTLDEATPGGLGVHLIRSFARSVDYERREGRNRLTLVLDRG
ncbi:MAG: ATP-binding protein [Burkholderiales bacterium]|nr:ATP-binding protein [Burkholderiales bacterium]